jgi:hypothetical protein
MRKTFNAVIFLALVLSSAASANTEDLVDFGKTAATDWEIISDGYAVPAGAGGTVIKYAELETLFREKHKVLGLRFPVPAVHRPSYLVLKPVKGISAGSDMTMRDVSLTVRGFNWSIDVAVLAHDQAGRTHELYLGSLDFDGWKKITFQFPFRELKMYGFTFTGLVFYPKKEYRDHTRDRVLYIEKLEIGFITGRL